MSPGHVASAGAYGPAGKSACEEWEPQPPASPSDRDGRAPRPEVCGRGVYPVRTHATNPHASCGGSEHLQTASLSVTHPSRATYRTARSSGRGKRDPAARRPQVLAAASRVPSTLERPPCPSS
jgi:hypothetical protein